MVTFDLYGRSDRSRVVSDVDLTLQDPSEQSETWSLAFFVGMADELSSSCRSLLAWRKETCPLRGREVSGALDHACCQFDDKYQALLARLDSCTSLSPEEKVGVSLLTHLVWFATRTAISGIAWHSLIGLTCTMSCLRLHDVV